MRDLTKVLSDAETLKLRALLAQTPDLPTDDRLWQEYPKMLYHRDYVALYRLVKTHPDPLVQKEAQQNLRRVIVIVHTIEDEEDYLADGEWKTHPADWMVAAGEPDPRIPTGKEGRRAGVTAKATREAELRDLRRRYAELTGTRLEDAPEPAPTPVAEDPVAIVRMPAPPSKREKVAAAAKRASAPTQSAHA